MGIYSKSKTTVSGLTVSSREKTDKSFKVGINDNNVNIVINYLTNLYSNPAKAVIRELFTNAADAVKNSDNKSIVIGLNKDDDSETKTYTLTVTDFGTGMSYDTLKNNYVSYANSTKNNDFDSVGSFGLGSKSPMAIVPGYKVTSNNGNEENCVEVYRKSDGIFADINAVADKKNYSYTTVTVEGIAEDHAKTIDNYICNNIIAFSSEDYDVVYNRNFDGYSNKRLDSILLREEPYPVRLYYRDKDAIIDYYRHIDCNFSDSTFAHNFIKLCRINGSVCYSCDSNIYAVFNDNKSYGFKGHNAFIVCDVESGYFPFAPAREELPHGDELSFIKNYLNHIVTAEDLLKIIATSGIYDDDQLVNLVLGGILPGKILDYINTPYAKKILELFNTDEEAYIAHYKLTNSYDQKFNKDEGYYRISNVISNTVIRKLRELALDNITSLDINDKNYYRYEDIADLRFVNSFKNKKNGVGSSRSYEIVVITNCKTNRKGEYQIPTKYRVKSVRNYLKLNTSNCYYNDYYVICVKDNKIPSCLKTINKYGSVKYNNDRTGHFDNINVVDATKVVAEHNTNKFDRNNRQVSISYYGNNSKRWHKTMTLSEINENGIGADYFCNFINNSYTGFPVTLAANVSGKTIAAVEYAPKYVCNAISCSGTKQIDFSVNKDSYNNVVDSEPFNVDNIIDLMTLDETLSSSLKSYFKKYGASYHDNNTLYVFSKNRDSGFIVNDNVNVLPVIDVSYHNKYVRVLAYRIVNALSKYTGKPASVFLNKELNVPDDMTGPSNISYNYIDDYEKDYSEYINYDNIRKEFEQVIYNNSVRNAVINTHLNCNLTKITNYSIDNELYDLLNKLHVLKRINFNSSVDISDSKVYKAISEYNDSHANAYLYAYNELMKGKFEKSTLDNMVIELIDSYISKINAAIEEEYGSE